MGQCEHPANGSFCYWTIDRADGNGDQDVCGGACRHIDRIVSDPKSRDDKQPIGLGDAARRHRRCEDYDALSILNLIRSNFGAMLFEYTMFDGRIIRQH